MIKPVWNRLRGTTHHLDQKADAAWNPGLVGLEV
jgi:hypothetical protein